MKKEYYIFLSVGLIILAYLLDVVANPLEVSMSLPTPYHYFTAENILKYAFTSTSILLKALAIVFSLPTILAALDLKSMAKGIILLISSGLLQLYALQDVATNARVIPLEWSLALTLAGLILLLPAIVFILLGFINSSKNEETPNSTSSTI